MKWVVYTKNRQMYAVWALWENFDTTGCTSWRCFDQPDAVIWEKIKANRKHEPFPGPKE